MVRRLSWGGRKSRDAEEEIEEVEVLELFSATTTNETMEKESRKDVAQPKRKERYEEEKEEGREVVQSVSAYAESDYVVAGDVSLQTPPTKRRRMLSQSITAMETLIEVIADEEEVLSTRLEYCSNLWRFVREMHPQDIVEFVHQRGSNVVRVIEALLHTGYFPLQQLCFMTAAAILYQLHERDTDGLAAFIVACKQYLSDRDVDLLELLPLREAIAWHDPRVARQRIVQINRRTGLCHSFRASRCWVSPNTKQELARIRVNKWIDIGSTTTTFYWRDQNDVVVVNVPHSCVEDVEIERENCILYIWTKHIDRLKGVRLLALASTEVDFPGLVKALVGVEIEGYSERPVSPITSAVEFGSPIHTLKTASTLVLANKSPPRSPVSSIDESSAFEPDADYSAPFEPDNEYSDPGDPSVEDSEPIETGVVDPSSPRHSNSIGSLDSEPEASNFTETLRDELNEKLKEANQRVADSLESLHERLDASRESVTDTFSRISSAHIESNHELAQREYQLREQVDTLQKKRHLDLPNAEFVVEDRISRASFDADDHMEDALGYAAENLLPDDQDFVFTTTSIIMLLIVVIPWVLFAVLHSGSDLGSVRQLAQHAMLLLTAALRELSA